MKPETRQEMASWLNSNLKLDHDDYTEWFYYSPDGFFAVWDAVEAKGLEVGIVSCISNDYKTYTAEVSCTASHERDEWEIERNDRYDAFYSAVYEAINNKE